MSICEGCRCYGYVVVTTDRHSEPSFGGLGIAGSSGESARSRGCSRKSSRCRSMKSLDFGYSSATLSSMAPTRIFRRVPLTQRPEDYSQFVGNVEVLDMMNDLNQIVSWVEKNHPDGERCSDLREMCRRLLKRLDRIDPSV